MTKKSKTSSKRKKSTKKPILKKINYLGLNHEKVPELYEGDPKFVNYMNVGGEKGDVVAAVYYVKEPNREKGHKNYLLLWRYYDLAREVYQYMVSGMDTDEIKKHATVRGAQCLSCGKVLFSVSCHDFHTCGCKNDMFVDGGVDYLRMGAMKISKTQAVSINLLTDEIIIDKVEPTK